ncbi:MAG: histidine--tRNA ligase [Candidatus Omnitrophica bacterium]|nr:histidine--tRNA ligase [Candidatus Omnitrophota bacterium]
MVGFLFLWTTMRQTTLKGVEDILPADIHRWQFLEQQADEVFSRCGYQQIRIPIIEPAQLFVRSIGEQTDIVEKEMYSFTDRGERQICLRPEATASVVRAYLQHQFDGQGGCAQFYYYGPMFRGERPQAGRQRQFHQVGVEAIGSYSPLLDADVVMTALRYIECLGLRRYRLQLNSVGCPEDKTNYAQQLRDFLSGQRSGLCESCVSRLERNVLRVLDCKNSACRQIIASAPHIEHAHCAQCREHFAAVQEMLRSQKAEFEINPYLVRGLDYYTRTVFEIPHGQLGAQNAICAGGRYDNLVAELGGSPAGAVGFAFGMERLLIALESESTAISEKTRPLVYVAGLGVVAMRAVFSIVQEIRAQGVAAVFSYEERSLKSHLKRADKLKANHAVIIGEEELASGTILVRDMRRSIQQSIPSSLLRSALEI